MFSNVLQRNHSEHMMKLISFRQPKLFQFSNSVYFSLKSLKSFLKFFFLDIKTPQNPTDIDPMFLDESEQWFRKIFDHVFSFRYLKNLIFRLIRLLFKFLLWHFRLEQLSLWHFGDNFGFPLGNDFWHVRFMVSKIVWVNFRICV